tara:strand:- start:287 stop:484 length:198 start_codon:yes stop_codon:yes gene_type:complete
MVSNNSQKKNNKQDIKKIQELTCTINALRYYNCVINKNSLDTKCLYLAGIISDNCTKKIEILNHK